MPTDAHKKLIEKTSKTVESFKSGHISGEMGYKFRTFEFLSVIFLYKNSVDVKNPDILGAKNRNTFINEASDVIEKVKEQVRLDLKDLNFLVNTSSTLARFVVRASNRKFLKSNNFATEIDTISDNAVDFGSGFLRIWESKGQLKAKSVDPLKIIFDQYDFKNGLKIIQLRKTYAQVIEDERYNAEARNLLLQKLGSDYESKKNSEYTIYEVAEPTKDGGTQLNVVDTENELVFLSETLDYTLYYKFDAKKRDGFNDALGVGAYERVFNILVQSKVNAERLDKVLEYASKLIYQKQTDAQRDEIAGKNARDLDTGDIIAHKGNPIEPVNVGGTEQANLIVAQLNSLEGKPGQMLNVSEALQGNTLPSGTSGKLGNLLTENSASVLKEIKKDYAKFLSLIYTERVIPHILSLFDSREDLTRHLDKNDLQLIRENVVNYLVSIKEIEAGIEGEEFDLASAREEVKQSIKGKEIISGELLDQLRDEVQGIEPFISGEQISKAQTVAFLQDIREKYTANPDIFRDPFFIELLKKEAEYDAGIPGLEIENLLSELEA